MRRHERPAPTPMTQRQQFELMLRLSFFAFFRQVFRTLHPGLKYEESWHVEVICEAVISFLKDGDLQHLVINAPPRSLKSEIVSVALTAFLLGHDPSKRILCASYSIALAEALARDTRRIMESDWYRRIFLDTIIARANEEGIFTTAGGYRRTTSVTGSVTGFGADVTIVDDPIKPDDAFSQAIRDKTNLWLNNTLSSRANDKRHAKILLVMQRVHVDDPCAEILKRPKTRLLKLPAIADRDYLFDLGHGRQKSWDEGEPLQDEREHLHILEVERQKLGERTFLAQYLQEPAPLEGGMIKWAWFRFYDERPSFQPGDRHVFSWDTAMTDSGSADYSACTQWLIRKNQYFLLNIVRDRLLYPNLKRKLRGQIEVHPSAVILVEDKGSGMSVAQDLIRDGIGVIRFKPEGSKELRASLASDQIEAGNVFLPRNAPWLKDFEIECIAFPNGLNDDQVDSMSQAIIWNQKRLKKPKTALFGRYM